MEPDNAPKRQLLELETCGRIVKHDDGGIYAEIKSLNPHAPDDLLPAGMLMVYKKDSDLNKRIDLLDGDLYNFIVSPSLGWSKKNNKPEIVGFLKAIQEYGQKFGQAP